MGVESRRARWGGVLAGVAAVWGVYATCAVVDAVSSPPKTGAGWVALLLLGPVLYFVVEGAVELLSDRKSGARASVVRIVGTVAVLLIALALLGWLYWSFDRGRL